jgi:phosphopantothenoylcysteine decarboxylase/phosphopantothenate--cysteine ligase
MSDPSEIVEAALRITGIRGSLEGRRVLVTAGGTREPIDPVRFVGNRSSGKMGYALAEAAMRMGADVVLVSGPTHLASPRGVELIMVETAGEMWDEVIARAQGCSAVVMAAAVADFSPAHRSSEKIRKAGRDGFSLELEPTRDILKRLGEMKPPGQVLVGFAAEAGDPVASARGKLKAKGADMLVANDVTAPGSGFDSDTNRAVLLFADGRTRELDLMPKAELAALIWEEVAGMLGA